MRSRLENLGLKLKYVEGRITHPQKRIENLRLTLDDRIARLNLAIDRRIEKLRISHSHLRDRLLCIKPDAHIQRRRAELNRACKDLVLNHHRILDVYRLRFQHNLSRLEALSPLAVLLRGYAIAYSLPGRKVLRSCRDTAPGKKILVQLAEGQLECEVEKTDYIHADKKG